MLQDPRANLLVRVFFVSDADPVYGLFLTFWKMHNSKLGIIPELVNPPLSVVVVVFKENFL